MQLSQAASLGTITDSTILLGYDPITGKPIQILASEIKVYNPETTTSSPSASSSDSYTSNEVLLCQFNNNISDVYGNALTAFGNATIVANTYNPTTGSLNFSTSNDQVTVAGNQSFNLYGDFQLELWAKGGVQSQPYPSLLAGNQPYSTQGQLVIAFSHSAYPNKFSSFIYTSGSSPAISSTVSATDDSWHHIALGRCGENIDLKIDGNYQGSMTYQGEINFLAGIALGRNIQDGIVSSFAGDIYGLRVTNGIYRYPKNFIPNTMGFN